MLWINGYTSRIGQMAGLTPPPGRPFWAADLRMAGRVMNDWHWLFINGSGKMLSSAGKRFEAGYNYAAVHNFQLTRHALLCGNHLQIVASSQGVAFAEGIAAYLYEVKGIQIETAVFLQPCQAASTPQSRNAIDTRIVLKSKGDWVVNKRNEELSFADVIIDEQPVRKHFVRYLFRLPDYPFAGANELFLLRAPMSRLRIHTAHNHRQQAIWQSVHRAKLLLAEARERGHLPTDTNVPTPYTFSEN